MMAIATTVLALTIVLNGTLFIAKPKLAEEAFLCLADTVSDECNKWIRLPHALVNHVPTFFYSNFSSGNFGRLKVLFQPEGVRYSQWFALGINQVIPEPSCSANLSIFICFVVSVTLILLGLLIWLLSPTVFLKIRNT